MGTSQCTSASERSQVRDGARNWDSAVEGHDPADKGRVSHLPVSANSRSASDFASDSGLPGARTLILRGHTLQSRAALRDRLPLTLAVCGAAGTVRREAAALLTLSLALPLEGAWDVYWRLMGEGIEFDSQSHQELARLCTVQAHAAEMPGLEQGIPVRLEVRFREEERHRTRRAQAAHA